MMLKLDRRQLLATSAGLAFLSVLPRIVLADGHDTLKVGIAGETGDLDLLQNVSTLSSYTVVFDGLLHYGSGGKLEPGLATAWTVAEDGKSISFDLREGVTFSDGTPFDADAAEWNLKRWMGVADFSWIGIADAYESIVKDGPNKITVKLKRPVPAALLELSIVRPVRFLSPKAVDANGKQTAPIGTGPWIVEKYSSTETVLVRNDKYWGEKPAFSRMILKVVPDELARANALRAGELDVIGGGLGGAAFTPPRQGSRGRGHAHRRRTGHRDDDPRLFAEVAGDAGQVRARGNFQRYRPQGDRDRAVRRLCRPNRGCLPDHGPDGRQAS